MNVHSAGESVCHGREEPDLYLVFQVSHSKWNIDHIFDAGVFNFTGPVELACEPFGEKTLIERNFECPALPNVLRIYAAGRFVQYMVGRSAKDAPVAVLCIVDQWPSLTW